MESPTFVATEVKLGILICFQIPSLICHLFLIYHLIGNKQLREALRNHVILLFLIVNGLLITIDLSMILHFLRLKQLEENSIDFCTTWNFLDAFLSNLSAFLMMWASAERHLIIFHVRQIFNTNFKRLILHYLPLGLCVIYALIFYAVAVYGQFNCRNDEHFHYDEIFCGRTCYVHADVILSTIDLVINRITCSVLILIFNLALLLRVLHAKRARNQLIRWRRHKKLMIQMLSIATLYLLGTLPASIAELIHVFSLTEHNEEESVIQEEIFLYLFYFISLIIPFICLVSLPEISSKISSFICCKRATTNVTPHVALVTHRQPATIIAYPKRTTRNNVTTFQHE